MLLVPAVLVLSVVVYCSVRAGSPRAGDDAAEHRRDIDVWHVLMGLAMSAMLLGALTRPLAVAVLAVCAVALCWGVLAVDRRTGGAAHLRLVVGAGAMAVMTLPLAAPAVAAEGHRSIAGGAMAAMSPAGPPALPLVVVLLAALVGVAAVRLPAVARRASGAGARLDAWCDVAMAGAMATMLLGLL